MADNVDSRNASFAFYTSQFVQKANLPERDLIPIIPVGAKLVKRTSIAEENVGKTPGQYDFKTKKWFGLTGSRLAEGLSPQDIVRFATFPTENVGLRAANFPGLDVDTSSHEVCDMVVALAEQRLGHAPMRIREGAPRALLVYSRIGEEPIRKLKLIFTCGEGKKHTVELLGLGQQYLIHGVHPSGVRYDWAAEADLVSWGASSLTNITAQDSRNFFDALIAEILARGWRVEEHVSRSGALRPGTVVEEMEPIVTVEHALSALRVIPNTQDVFPSREDLIGVLASFKAAVGKESCKPEVYEDVREWACAGWPDADWIEGPWNSLTTVRVGPERLFNLARAHGWFADAQQDFKEPVDEEVIDETQAQADETIKTLAKKVVYWPEAGRFIERETKQQFSCTAFNAAPHLGVTIARSGTTGVRTAANILLNSGHVQIVSGMTYLPGQAQLVTADFNGKRNLYFNTWEANAVPQLEVKDKDVTPWLDHLEYLFEDETDRNYLIDFFAHICLRRGHKIRWAPVIVGAQGVGKDLMLKPILKGLGEKYNTRMVEPERIMSSFNDFWETELAVIQEITRSDRTDVYEKIKAIISGSASSLMTIERKYEKPYQIPLCVNMIFLTNHTDALNLSADDRRFFVIHSDSRPRDAAYYDALSAFYEKQHGWEKVFCWLKKRDISKFNPDARPLFNDAKQQMIEESQPYYVLWMRDTYLKQRGVIKVSDVLEDIATNFNYPQRIRDSLKGQAQVVRALRFAGWTNKQVRIAKERCQFWFKNEKISNETPEEIRARYIAEQDKKLVYAK